ncbi:FmdB family zinc ribbon protein [Verrucomicrobium sp. BvORR106]|uniref:FmdB family zinc ribbon protein n=1 Tax=Verrucomicrobium sp. BvORR106 TaxID=1403819 RepID=UPI0009DD0C66|nr:FmdB family zinc ribbon protein [Verrucomicrobium sp. BvORR106]
MPTYHYIAVIPENGCPRCSKGFDLRRPISRPPLTECPLCKTPVRKVITSVNTPRVSKPMSVSDAKSAGFTILEKRCDGSYEKL